MNPALNNVLIQAAQKALKSAPSDLLPKTTVKKADSGKPYTSYDLTLGEFYVPGHTQKGELSEEQKMVLGLRAMAKKLARENQSLKNSMKTEKEAAYKAGLNEGLKKGHAAGYEKGKKDTHEAVAKVQQNLAAVLKDFAQKKEDVLSMSERKTLEIVFLAVERIIHQEVKTDPNIILNVLKAAILEVAKTDKITVKVNPKEAEAVGQGKEFWVPINAQFSEIRVDEDSRIERGGCIIESTAGSVDARISTQIAGIREIFLKAWDEGMGAVS